MNTFYLIRHGQKEKLPGDPGLTEQGKKQAFLTGKYLKDKNITQLFSSPLRRTWQTAENINQSLDLKVVCDERLKERFNWGDKKGQSFEDFLKDWNLSNEDRNYQPQGGRSSFQSGKNIFGVISEINNEKNTENVVIVTHGGIICDLLRNVFTEAELLKVNELFLNMLDKLVHECSITTIFFDKGKFTVKEVGSTSHLTSDNTRLTS